MLEVANLHLTHAGTHGTSAPPLSAANFPSATPPPAFLFCRAPPIGPSHVPHRRGPLSPATPPSATTAQDRAPGRGVLAGSDANSVSDLLAGSPQRNAKSECNLRTMSLRHSGWNLVEAETHAANLVLSSRGVRHVVCRRPSRNLAQAMRLLPSSDLL
jgi:hypothetical protein